MTDPARRPWSDAERVLIRDHYQTQGAPWCAKQLGRPVGQVRQFAGHNGYARKDDDRRIPSSDFIDAAIRRAYQNPEMGSVARCARSVCRSPKWVSRRAGELGLTTRAVKVLPWSETEIAFVEARTHLSRGRISRLMAVKGWKRTAAQIQHLIHRKRLFGANDHFMPAATVAVCLGVHTDTVTKWIRLGELIAERRGWARTEAQHGDGYLVQDVEIARFIVRHRARVDLRKVDPDWFVDLIARYGSIGLIEKRSHGGQVVALDALGKSNAEIAIALDTTTASVAVTLSKHRAKARKQAEAA